MTQITWLSPISQRPHRQPMAPGVVINVFGKETGIASTVLMLHLSTGGCVNCNFGRRTLADLRVLGAERRGSCVAAVVDLAA